MLILSGPVVRLRKRECIAKAVCDRLVFLMISQTLLSRRSLRMLNELCVESKEQLCSFVPIPPPILESSLIKNDASFQTLIYCHGCIDVLGVGCSFLLMYVSNVFVVFFNVYIFAVMCC